MLFSATTVLTPTFAEGAEVQLVAPGPRALAGVRLDGEDVVGVHLQPEDVDERVRDVEVLLVDGVRQLVVGDLVHDDVPVTQGAGRQVPGQVHARLTQTSGGEVLGRSGRG